MADTNEDFQIKYFLLNNDRQQKCVLVWVCVNKKNKNQGQVIHETDRTGDGHNNPRGPALFSQAASLKTIKHNEKLVYPKKLN